MKDSMSNTDLRLILPELCERGEDTFIKNVYQYGDIFVLKLYKPGEGTALLLIHPGHRVHITEFARKAPRVPPKFCSVLRKYVKDKKLTSIKQYEFDRILVLEIGDEEQTYKLVAELFGTGNLLLLDPDDTIFVAMHYRRMKDRDIIPKAKYEFPPPRGRDLLSLEKGELESLFMDSNANVVRTLASRLNLDAVSCEEICSLASVSPTTMAEAMDSISLNDLERGVALFAEKLRSGVSEPRIILNEPEEEEEDAPDYLTFLPFEFELYEEYPFEVFESYSEAIDEYFGVSEEELEDSEAESAMKKERLRLQKIIDKQGEGIKSLETRAENMRHVGELIYSHFTQIQEILAVITQARADDIPWDEIIKRINIGKEKGLPSAELVKRIVPSQGAIIVQLNDTDVTLDIRMTAQDNAAKAYDSAKKAESKVKGALKQIERTKEKLSKLELSAPEPDQKPVRIKKRKRRWYEKFRWFFSSEGFLVLGGRDAKSNEHLAKRQMGPNDVFLHAALHGAPYTLVKVPDDPPGEATLEEAAQFAVTFSRAWQDGQSSGEAYWVNPEQVSFTPPSGEFLPAGAVMIYGTKNYLHRVPVELSVGVILEEEYAIPVSGPPSAIEELTEYNVRISPSDDKKGQLVKDIIHHLSTLVPDDVKPLVQQIPQEDMMRVLPAGGGTVAQ
jgi:predicted ribosome quality control (RQC) complex YloA/Tae2 family protein